MDVPTSKIPNFELCAVPPWRQHHPYTPIASIVIVVVDFAFIILGGLGRTSA